MYWKKTLTSLWFWEVCIPHTAPASFHWRLKAWILPFFSSDISCDWGRDSILTSLVTPFPVPLLQCMGWREGSSDLCSISNLLCLLPVSYHDQALQRGPFVLVCVFLSLFPQPIPWLKSVEEPLVQSPGFLPPANVMVIFQRVTYLKRCSWFWGFCSSPGHKLYCFIVRRTICYRTWSNFQYTCSFLGEFRPVRFAPSVTDLSIILLTPLTCVEYVHLHHFLLCVDLRPGCPGSHRDLLVELGPEDLVLLTLGSILLLRLFHAVIHYAFIYFWMGACLLCVGSCLVVTIQRGMIPDWPSGSSLWCCVGERKM